MLQAHTETVPQQKARNRAGVQAMHAAAFESAPAQFERLPVHVANYLLWLAEHDGVRDMTPMKLMKLVYFSYAWFLVLTGQKLFAEKVEAWKFGPVVPSLYHEFKRFGNRRITDYAEYYDAPDSDTPQYLMLDEKDRYAWRITAAVWRNYRKLSGVQLSAITHHSDSPWTEAYAPGQNIPLGEEKMRARATQAIDEYLLKVKQGAV